MNTLCGSGLYVPSGPESAKPWLRYKLCASLKAGCVPVSRLCLVYPRCRATAMMCSSTVRPAPLPRAIAGVRIDLISPCVGDSSFSAPQPNKVSSSHTVQGDAGRTQCIEIQRKHLLGRRQLVHVGEVFLQQSVDLWMGKVVNLDLHKRIDLQNGLGNRSVHCCQDYCY